MREEKNLNNQRKKKIQKLKFHNIFLEVLIIVLMHIRLNKKNRKNHKLQFMDLN